MADELTFLLAVLLTTLLAVAPIVAIADWRPVARLDDRFAGDADEGR